MKKKKVLVIIIIIIVSLLSYLGYGIINQVKEKNEITKQLQIIPKFQFKTLDSKSFTNSNLKTNTPTIFIYFNSECDFCHHEAESISKSLDKFKNIQFIFVSTENINTINQFSEKHKLNNHSNITFLYDSDYLFTHQFNANSIPYVLIYNKNKKLIKKQNGQLNSNEILRILKEND